MNTQLMLFSFECIHNTHTVHIHKTLNTNNTCNTLNISTTHELKFNFEPSFKSIADLLANWKMKMVKHLQRAFGSYDRFCLRILEHATEKHPSTLSCSLLCACFWLVGLLRLLMTSSASSVTRVFCHVAPGVEPASLKTHAINYLTARIAWRAATVPRFNENTGIQQQMIPDIGGMSVLGTY